MRQDEDRGNVSKGANDLLCNVRLCVWWKIVRRVENGAQGKRRKRKGVETLPDAEPPAIPITKAGYSGSPASEYLRAGDALGGGHRAARRCTAGRKQRED